MFIGNKINIEVLINQPVQSATKNKHTHIQRGTGSGVT